MIDGFTYEESAIEEWFSHGKLTSPMTNLEISSEVMENTVLKERIEEFLREKQFESLVIGDGDDEGGEEWTKEFGQKFIVHDWITAMTLLYSKGKKNQKNI